MQIKMCLKFKPHNVLNNRVDLKELGTYIKSNYISSKFMS